MEQKQSSSGGSVCHQLPPLSAKYPWFVSQNTGSDEDSSRDQYFYTLHDPFTKYQCQIPELLGRRIRGYYHGWVILSDRLQNVTWSLLNPVTSQMIHFPPLILEDGNSESIRECCLLAPPDDPSSVLLLTRINKPSFVFFRLNGFRENLKWIEMSYASELKRISGEDDDFLHELTCCNGKMYAFNGKCPFACFIIQLDILVKVDVVTINLSLLGTYPTPSWVHCDDVTYFLKGYCTELFIIMVAFHQKTLEAVLLIKLDMTSVKSEDIQRFKHLDMSCKRWEEEEDHDDISASMDMWEQLFDLKDAVFLLDLGRDNLAYYRPGIASELGGYIHIRDRVDDILYSYHLKGNTISLSYMPSLVLPTSNVSLWECRLEDDSMEDDSKQEENEIVVRPVTDNEVGLNESNLLNLPFEILEMIMEHCVCVEYLNFRATCKLCHVAAPLVQWSNKTSSMRLQTYSLVSPWLMVVDRNQDIISFIDPMLGDKYFMKISNCMLAHQEICCSRFGWLLFFSYLDLECLVFFNPFTTNLRKLPRANYGFYAAGFSAPPTSPGCIVVGFPKADECIVLILHVAQETSPDYQEPSWLPILVGTEPNSLCFPTFFGQNLYALGGDGKLIGFKDLGEEDYSTTFVEATVPIHCGTSPTRYYLMKCDQNLLKVIVGKFGESVEVSMWDFSKEEWEKIHSLGNRMIYICGTTCLCIEAKTREMENKIYFPKLHSKNKKIVFYSLETCTYETFNGEPLKDFVGTTYHLFPHTWIEPSWL